jgi:hypothetical protein
MFDTRSLGSLHEIPMLLDAFFIVKHIGTDKEEILDARKGCIERARVIVVYMAKSNSSLFELFSIRLARRGGGVF